MNINIGKKIRELRISGNLTQNELAEALGVSSQAVSRWEIGSSYPDMELIPSIANFLGVTIDELFDCAGERDEKINAIIDEAEKLSKYDDGRDINIEKRLTLLRNGLSEFPRNEKLMYALAETLSNAGWARIGETLLYDDEGYLLHDIKRHAENEYWNEAIKLYEVIIATAKDPKLLNNSVHKLIQLYCNIGEYEKGLALADTMPTIDQSRELLRPWATDGSECNRYYKEAVQSLANAFATYLIQLIISKRSNLDDIVIPALSGMINYFDSLVRLGILEFCPQYIQSMLFLSMHQWRSGLHDEAFRSLDNALVRARDYDKMLGEDAPDELKGAPRLSEDWPWYHLPGFDAVKAEITADPMWADWVRRTKE